MNGHIEFVAIAPVQDDDAPQALGESLEIF
jgi:hypothetical protein